MRTMIDKLFQAAKNKDIDALDGIFTQDAVMVECTGRTYCGLDEIRRRFAEVAETGRVTAWDLRRIVQEGENGAAVWYYEYRDDSGETCSFDGVSVIEMKDGKIGRWSEFAQTTNKTYPFAD